jgi:hypothetical protein
MFHLKHLLKIYNREEEMIYKLIPFLMLAVALFFIGCKQENQPTQNKSDLELQGLNKKPLEGDLITFTGDLEGIPQTQLVIGCCPNAGPSPPYTMMLSSEIFPTEISGRALDGYIFMNNFGRNLPWAYKVSFWWPENNAQDTLIIVRGGIPYKDKRTKILTVTFTQDTCWIYYPNGDVDTVYVDFKLIRDPQRG